MKSGSARVLLQTSHQSRAELSQSLARCWQAFVAALGFTSATAGPRAIEDEASYCQGKLAEAKRPLRRRPSARELLPAEIWQRGRLCRATTERRAYGCE